MNTENASQAAENATKFTHAPDVRDSCRKAEQLRESLPYIHRKLCSLWGLAEIAEEDTNFLVDFDFDGDTKHTAVTNAMEAAADAFAAAGRALQQAADLIGEEIDAGGEGERLAA